LGREEDLHGVCTTQPHRLAKGDRVEKNIISKDKKKIVSSVVDQNIIDHFFFSPQ
jgi:hypothetical protein